MIEVWLERELSLLELAGVVFLGGVAVWRLCVPFRVPPLSLWVNAFGRLDEKDGLPFPRRRLEAYGMGCVRVSLYAEDEGTGPPLWGPQEVPDGLVLPDRFDVTFGINDLKGRSLLEVSGGASRFLELALLEEGKVSVVLPRQLVGEPSHGFVGELIED